MLIFINTMMKTVQLIIFFALFCGACSEKKQENVIFSSTKPQKSEFASERKIALKCNGNPYFYGQTNVCVSDKDSLYSGTDIEKTALFIYDLAQNELVLKYSPPSSGPDAFHLDLFYVSSRDSIFIFDKKKAELRLIDIEGNLKKSISLAKVFDSLKNTGYSCYIQHYSANRLVFSKGQLLIPLYPEIENEKPEFYEKGYTASIDLKMMSLKIFGKYAESVKANAKGYFPYAANVQLMQSGENFWVGFSNEHCLYQLNPKENALREAFCVQSNYLPKDFDRLPGNEDFQERDNFSQTNPFYQTSLTGFGKIYRIVRHAQALKNEKGEINSFFATSWSIISVNPDGSDAKEVLMPANQYRVSDVHLIGKDQFLVSRENDQNPENNEELLELEIISLK
jgi:hypothetical protein